MTKIGNSQPLTFDMIVIEKQPAEISFVRNPVEYQIKCLDINSKPFSATGVKGIITINTNFPSYLKHNETLTISWNTASDNYSYTFTGFILPQLDDQLQSSPHTMSPQEYMQSWADKFQNHPVISAFFNVDFFTTSDLAGVVLEDKNYDENFEISFDYSNASEFSDTNFSTEEYQPSTLPDNYKVKVDVFFQSNSPSGIWKEVARLEETPDAESLININLEDILDAEMTQSFEVPDVPPIFSNEPYIANNLRRFYVRFSEHYGEPVEEQYSERSEIKHCICGGVDQERFAEQEFFSLLDNDNSILTWYPDGKTVSTAQPEYLSWFNSTGKDQRIALRLTTYDQLLTASESYIFDEETVTVEKNQTIVIPVGFEQLGLSNENIRKYSVQVVTRPATGIDSDGNETPINNEDRVDLSQTRKYYVDCNYHECLRYILYFDAFCLPNILRLTGQTKKQLRVDRGESTRILQLNYQANSRQKFQYQMSWENPLTYRTGYHSKAEVDALQQLLIYNDAYEILENSYRPIHITDKQYHITECLQFLHALEFKAVRALKAKNYSNELMAFENCCIDGALIFDGNTLEFEDGLVVTF